MQVSDDVMPSYQRVQNDNWNDFLVKNEEYMKQVQQNIKQSEIQAEKTIQLTYLSLMSLYLHLFSIWQFLCRLV